MKWMDNHTVREEKSGNAKTVPFSRAELIAALQRQLDAHWEDQGIRR